MKVLIDWIIQAILGLNLGFFSTLLIFVILAILVLIIFGRKYLSKFINIVFYRKTCGDKVVHILGIKSKYEIQISELNESILINQMNYVEQKIQSIIFMLGDTYNIQQKENEYENTITKNKEFTLYIESLKNALNDVKDEIRRSFKENGFYNMSDIEFNKYIEDRVRMLLCTARNYLIYHYPHEDMIVSLSDRFSYFNKYHFSEFKDIVRNIYINAKKVRHNKKKKVKALHDEFSNKVDEIIG